MRDLSRRYFEQSGVRYAPFHHLSYKHPLLLGGSDSDLGNLELSKSLVHMRLAGQIVSQVKSLPRGTKITRVIVDEDKLEVKLVAD